MLLEYQGITNLNNFIIERRCYFMILFIFLFYKLPISILLPSSWLSRVEKQRIVVSPNRQIETSNNKVSLFFTNQQLP